MVAALTSWEVSLHDSSHNDRIINMGFLRASSMMRAWEKVVRWAEEEGYAIVHISKSTHRLLMRGKGSKEGSFRDVYLVKCGAK